MAVYYVDFATGADTSDGLSIFNPWKHCPGDVNATDNANITLSVGDTVVFKGGIDYKGTIVINQSGAASDSRVRFVSGDKHTTPWGAGKGVITGETTVRGQGFVADSKKYVEIYGFEIKEMVASAQSSGIYIDGTPSTYWWIHENSIHDIYGSSPSDQGYGIEINGQATSDGYHIVEKNTIYHCGAKAIETWRAGHNTIRYNFLSETRDHNIVLSSSSNDVYNNILENAGFDWGGGTPYDPSFACKCDPGTGVAADNNRIWNNIIVQGTAGLGIFGGTGNTFVQNTVFYTGMQYYPGANSGLTTAAFAIWDAGVDAPDDSIVKNNIFYYNCDSESPEQHGVLAFWYNIGNGNLIKYNSIYHTASFLNNVHYRAPTSSWHDIAWFEGASGFSAIGSGNVASNNVAVAPLFSGGIVPATLFANRPTGFNASWVPNITTFDLIAGNPDTMKGENLGSPFDTDILGNPRSNWWMGAYEYAFTEPGFASQLAMILK